MSFSQAMTSCAASSDAGIVASDDNSVSSGKRLESILSRFGCRGGDVTSEDTTFGFNLFTMIRGICVGRILLLSRAKRCSFPGSMVQ